MASIGTYIGNSDQGLLRMYRFQWEFPIENLLKMLANEVILGQMNYFIIHFFSQKSGKQSAPFFHG